MNVTLGRIPPIDLAEMDAGAALRIRRDRKYVVPIDGLSEIVDSVDLEAVRILEIDRRRSSGYESVYFDTPDLACYWAAARRRRRRFKVRTRRYLEDGDVFVEVKVRDRGGFTAKHRLVVGRQDHGRLTAAGKRFLDGVAGVRTDPDRLHPTLVTRYRRATFVTLESPARMTIDIGLTWALPDGAQLHVPDIAIVETKSVGPPTDFDRLLWRTGHRPIKISKYGTGLAALDHTLPANKWHRVLQDNFGLSGSRPKTTNGVSKVADSPLRILGAITQGVLSQLSAEGSSVT